MNKVGLGSIPFESDPIDMCFKTDDTMKIRSLSQQLPKYLSSSFLSWLWSTGVLGWFIGTEYLEYSTFAIVDDLFGLGQILGDG